MKKLFLLAFTFVLFFSFNGYAELTCKDTLDIDENREIFQSLFSDENYSYNNYNGKLCFIGNDGTVSVDMKNGKLSGGMEYVYMLDGKKALYIYSSSYTFLTAIASGSVDPTNLESLGKAISEYDAVIKIYHDNGNPVQVLYLKKGNGSRITYREDGSMLEIATVKNFSAEGQGEVYDERGRVFATIIYKNDRIIAGKCVNQRKNGSEWTKAEISNWENGLEVDCSYF